MQLMSATVEFHEDDSSPDLELDMSLSTDQLGYASWNQEAAITPQILQLKNTCPWEKGVYRRLDAPLAILLRFDSHS